MNGKSARYDLQPGLHTTDVATTRPPKAPARPEELDIPRPLVEDLILRKIYTKGTVTLQELSGALKLPFSLLHSIFQEMRKQQLFEITGMQDNDYIFTLSGIGRDLAVKRFLISHYAGPAPVSLATYTKVIRSQAANPCINHSSLKEALSDLVVTERFLDELGPALASQKSIFLYGPTGNGKTSVVTRLSRTYRDSVAIPYALEVDGQIIVLHDPAIHESAGNGKDDLDPRWVLCRRPCIVVGGELEPSMLELQLEENTKVYAAPVQMRANNGILVIDDFGRQILSPKNLLNRWIVPLDRRVDYLTLKYGLKFQIPFEMTVVFATNLNPSDLADEAFLRRIPNKIYVDPVDAGTFDAIFNRIVAERKLPCEPDSAKSLREHCLKLGSPELRACQPKDILDIVAAISTYEERDTKVTPEALKRAAELYFARTRHRDTD
jgi:Cdc6-like AAA superfamily ATPase